MVNKKSGLGGKGLDGLLGGKREVVAAVSGNEMTGQIQVAKLSPNPFQPRKTFEPGAMADLVASIKERGVIQPLIVRAKGKGFEIVAGERRWRAAKEAGLLTVPAVVRNYNDRDMMEVALIENIQREDLNPMEEARGMKTMMDELGITQDEVALKLGRSQTYVSIAMRLLGLPENMQGYLERGELNVGQTRQLMSLSDSSLMGELADRAVRQNWSMGTIKEVVREYNEGHKIKIYREKVEELKEKEPRRRGRPKKGEEKSLSAKDIYLQTFREELISALGTKVHINAKEKGGQIIIEYYTNDDLERLRELLLPEEKAAGNSAAAKKGKFAV